MTISSAPCGTPPAAGPPTSAGPLPRTRALLFTVKNFWATLGVCLLQLVWWLLMVLFAPWTLILVPLVAVWFDLFAALFLLYDRLDAAFGIEASLAQAFPDQVPRRDC